MPGREDELRQHGNFVRDSLIVRDFRGTIPLLSDVAISADSGGAWQPRPGLHLRPSPGHHSGPDGLAWIFLEAYNLTPGGTYTAHVRLDKAVVPNVVTPPRLSRSMSERRPAARGS